MSCQFTIPFTGRPNDILSKAKFAIHSQDGTFNGDESAGDFSVSVLGSIIKGSYAVAGQQLNIVIESKPFLIPCSTIESFLRNKLG